MFRTVLTMLTALGLGACADTSSGDALAEQQQTQGWGPAQCPAPPDGVSVGYGVGEQIAALELFDCAGEPVELTAFCGAEVLWLSFAHMWCPHCVKAGSEMEAVHQSYVDAGRDLASVSIVVEDVAGNRPDESDCSGWREQQAQNRVITLYDDDTDSFVLWEVNLTNLNVIISEDRVIRTKLHTDIQADIRAALDGAFD